VWLSCTWTNPITLSVAQIPSGDGRASAKARTTHTATKKQYVQILFEWHLGKSFTKASECSIGVTLGVTNQSIYRNRLQMTAPVRKKWFYLTDVLCSRIVGQILSNQAQIAI